MIVNLQNLMTDGYGKYEQPTLLLTTMSDDPICYIGNPLSLTANFYYNDVSEINFTVADKIQVNGEWVEDPAFAEIVGMRKIVMEPYGVFLINNPTIKEEGTRRTKEVTCQSFEISLSFREMPPLEGTLQFHDPTGLNKDTITNIVMESASGWKFSTIPSSISKKYRTWDTTSQSVYAFLSGDCATSYGCLFTYDTFNKIIYVRDIADEVGVSPIHLDRYNLIESQDIEQLSDEIVTCLSVYGADDVSIREVSPLASPKIYNLDYFIEIGDVDADTAMAWNAWKEKFNIYQKLFSDLYAQYYSNQLVANNELTKLTDLKGEMSAMEAEMDTYLTDVNGDHEDEKEDLRERMRDKQLDINAQQSVVDRVTKKLEDDLRMMADITTLCSFEKNFTEDQLSVIQAYIKEDSIQESSFQCSNIADTPNAAQSISEDNIFSVRITNADLYRTDDYAELTDEEWEQLDLSAAEKLELQKTINALSETYLGHRFYSINTGRCSIESSDGTFELYGEIVDSTVSFSDIPNNDGSTDCIVAFGIQSPSWNGDETSYSNALFVVSGKLTNFTYDSDINSTDTDTMSFSLTGGIMTLTCDSSINMRQHILQDLYEYGKSALDELAYPSYEFSVKPANLFTAADFEWFRQNIKLGEKVYVGMGEDDYYISPILTGCEVDFYDPTALELIFSSRFQHKSEAFTLADMIGKTAHTAASLDASKFNYNAYIDSNIQNDVDRLINGTLDVAKNNVVNSSGQDILINGQGIHLKKYDRATGTYDPGEVRMTNGQIVFTNDSWNTASLAIGKLETPDGATTMGIVGQSIIGEVLIGNKLLIEATNYDDNFAGDVTHFRVDAGGVKMANGAIYIQGYEPHNQIIIDPQYGIMAGDNTLFKMSDSKFELNILDDEGKVKYDTVLYRDYGIKLPEGAAFYFDIDTGSLAFRGDVYADNGYFKGTVHATDGSFTGTVTATDGSFTGAITATSLDCTNAKVVGLEVGENVIMGPNAKITWAQLPGDVADTSEIVSEDKVTTITQEAISTGNIIIGGWIWDSITSSEKQRVLGVNWNENLQVGTVSNANYKHVNIYAPENIYLVPNKGTTANAYKLKVSGDGVDVGGALTVNGVDVALSKYYGNESSSSVSVTVSTNAFRKTSSTTDVYLGGSSYPWKLVYADSAEIITSDRNKKDDIKDVNDQYLAMFDLLNPVTYKKVNGDRTHVGFISQDVYAAMQSVGLTDTDFAGFCRDIKHDENNVALAADSDENYDYALRYTEFIGLAVAKIKQLESRIKDLETRS